MELTHCQFCLEMPVDGSDGNICEFCRNLAVASASHKRMRKLRTNDRGEICIECMRFCRHAFMVKHKSYCMSCRSIKGEKYRKKRRVIYNQEKIIRENSIAMFEDIARCESVKVGAVEQNWDNFAEEVKELYETEQSKHFQHSQQTEQFDWWASQVIN
ncbi:Hypothetical protein PACV_77 [Pacmanvirus A23]|uniref:Hypothetical protein n=1 Tax=Pacmanvirus A23 TaxID=1932881 RepID=UPI000A0944B2|nr:Hypothetical protein B9W72_gp077 [Pacmanvirus A23]SIP85794.1 Hypothetical protein PACV_77 [Pacmanvirus A23]